MQLVTDLVAAARRANAHASLESHVNSRVDAIDEHYTRPVLSDKRDDLSKRGMQDANVRV